MIKNSIKSKVVGVDISIHRTTYAVVDIRGNILAEDSFDTSEYPDVNNFMTRLCESIYELVEANGGYDTIRSVGISSPSANSKTASIVNAANLPWKGVIPLAAMMRDRLGLAVGLANDAHISALGEHAFGVAHGMKDFIIISLGVGVGSCFFSDGKEHHGHEGYAGEIGHCMVVGNGRECGCGKRGCLEAYVGAKGIVKTAQELMQESGEPSLMRQQTQLTPRIIAELCDQGDKLAIETFRKTGEMLGIGLANYASVINPEAIILTGGISHAGHWLTDSADVSFNENIFQNMRGKVKLMVSKLDDRERDVLGASVLAWEQPEYSLFK